MQTTHSRARRHHLWLGVHRWLAFLLGLPLALLGASGALMELRAPILRWEVGAAALQAPAPPAGAQALDDATLRRRAEQAYPRFARILGSAAPRQGFLTSDNAMLFGPLRDRPGSGIAMLDAYDGTPRGFFVFEDLWLSRIVTLHRSLLLPPAVAMPLLIACAGVLCASLASGLYLWWPQRRGGRAAFGLRRGARGSGRWRLWHNLFATWLYLPLLLIAVTGLVLPLPRGALGAPLRATLSALHGHLALGLPGMLLAGLAGLALPGLYLSGLLLWWRRSRQRSSVLSQGILRHD